MLIIHRIRNFVPLHESIPFAICVAQYLECLKTKLNRIDKKLISWMIFFFLLAKYIASGGGTVWAMWASGPPTFWTVWAWPTHFWHYFLLFLFCLSPLIINFFQDWPTHFQNRSAAAEYSQRTSTRNSYFIHQIILVCDNMQRKLIVTSLLCNGTIHCMFSSHRLVHNKLTRFCTIFAVHSYIIHCTYSSPCLSPHPPLIMPPAGDN